MDLSAIFSELQQGLDDCEDSEVDWDLKSELLLNRKQVTDLKKELYETNVQMFQLQNEFDSVASQLKDIERNEKHSTVKHDVLEAQIKELNLRHENHKIKDEIRIQELRMLNTHLEEISCANYNLTQENAELKEKLKIFDYFQQESSHHRRNMESAVQSIKNNIQKYKLDQVVIRDCHKKINQCDDLMNYNVFLTAENRGLQEEKKEWEGKLLATTAKFSKLTELKSKHEEKFKENSRIVEYEARITRLEQEEEAMRIMLKDFEKTLKPISEVNIELFISNQEYLENIKDLEKKIQIKSSIMQNKQL